MAIVLRSTPLLWTRLAALVCTCVAFSVAVHGAYLYHGTGDWCIFCWAGSFAATLLVLLVEVLGLQERAPVSWRNFPITLACYAALLCLSASIIFPLFFLKGTAGYGDVRVCRIVSTVFSCLATVAYAAEVSQSRARPGEAKGYMASAPGLLKVCQTFVACVMFVLLSDPPLYDRHHAARYCFSVYCVCFILTAALILLCLGECTGVLPCPFARVLTFYGVGAALLYLSAAVVWPVFAFDPQHGGTRARPYNCGSDAGLCVWDKSVGVAALTALNALLYLADLVHSSRLVFLSA